MANNSSLPKIIPTLRIHFEMSGKEEKSLFGPMTEPNPGPTFDIEVAAPEIEVIKSNPLIDNNIAIIKNINKKVKMKIMTDFINSSEIF